MIQLTEPKEFRIWVDADACPVAIRDILFRTSKRCHVRLTFVANATVRTPPGSKLIDAIAVPHGADAADKKIIELVQSGDIVITQDIPLAAAIVEKGAVGIGTRGQLFDDSTVQEYLVSRDIGEQLRAAGMDTRGPKPHSAKQTQAFANQLDRLVTKRLAKQQRARKDDLAE